MGLVEAQGLSVQSRLSGGRSLQVLSDVSFALEAGKVLGLVGESGAGKSMIGRTIAQLLPRGFAVTEGSLSFSGEDLLGMPPERRRSLLGRDIAFIPQEPLSALNPVLTVASNSTSISRASAARPRASGASRRSPCSMPCICRVRPRSWGAIRISSRAACASAC